VLDDFGKLGHSYRETDEAEVDERMIIEFTRAMRDATGNLPPCPVSSRTPWRRSCDTHPTAFVSLSIDRLTGL
jgi:hypothetical protein